MLAELVKAGKLPPVAERLPKEPAVCQVVEEIGQYGGTWRRAHLGASDLGGADRYVREALIQFSTDGSKFEPNVFSKWEIADGGKTFTFKIREGLKWSNGKPLTADDFLFVHEDYYMNKELSPTVPSFLNFGGTPATLEKVDNFTLKYKFAKAYPLFVQILAEPNYLMLQKEYFQQFHAKYADKAKLDAAVKDAKFETWMQLFNAKNALYDNPDMPTWHVWVTKSRVADQRHIMERNPYYWKVDPKGNQLPYIDTLVHDLVGSADIIVTKCIAGEIDFQGRNIATTAMPLLKENEAKGGYRTIIWTPTLGSSITIMFNLSFDGDPVVAKYMHDKRFRQAFSMAIDRDDINRVIYLNQGKARQATVIDSSADFKAEYATRYAKLDLAAANKLLDELGLTKKDGEGYRIAPEDGKPLTLINYFATLPPYDSVAPLITEYLKKVGIKVLPKGEERSIHYQRMDANELQLSMWGMDGAIYPVWLNYAYWIVPWVGASSRLGRAIGLYRDSAGKSGKAPTGDVAKALEIFDQAWAETDDAKRVQLASQVLDIASENVWTIGTVLLAQEPHVTKNNFRNVPTSAVSDWVFRTEKNTHPEQYFFKK